MYLDSTTKTIEAFMAAAINTTNPTYSISYNDHTTTSLTPGDTQGSLNGTSVVTILAAPAASAQRQITNMSIYNNDTKAHSITIQKDVSSTNIEIITVTLNTRESLHWTRDNGWIILDSAGRMCITNPTSSKGINGLCSFFYKAGTVSDAIGYNYSFGKDIGFPGAWAPGTPGLAGRATDGTDAADAGCLLIPNADKGDNYLTNITLSSTVTSVIDFHDILWVNSGLSVTTTTAQTVNSVILPPRDNRGTANGTGVMIGALAVSALGNAGVVSNSTVSYTNSNGVSGRTATLEARIGSQFPATPVVGTLVWFRLQAGDRGVRSIQSITLGTSLVSGTISFVLARLIARLPVPVINTGAQFFPRETEPGVRLYNGSCILISDTRSATTANVIFGNAYIMER